MTKDRHSPGYMAAYMRERRAAHSAAKALARVIAARFGDGKWRHIGAISWQFDAPIDLIETALGCGPFERRQSCVQNHFRVTSAVLAKIKRLEAEIELLRLRAGTAKGVDDVGA
jgi:hypothetical protein